MNDELYSFEELNKYVGMNNAATLKTNLASWDDLTVMNKDYDWRDSCAEPWQPFNGQAEIKIDCESLKEMIRRAVEELVKEEEISAPAEIERYKMKHK